MAAVEPLEIDHLRHLTGIKWSRYGPDVLPAWVADMDIAPPPVVVEALRALVDRGDFGYNRHALAQLPDVFARWQAERHGWAIDPGDVRVFCDVLHAIDTALWLLTGPGDGENGKRVAIVVNSGYGIERRWFWNLRAILDQSLDVERQPRRSGAGAAPQSATSPRKWASPSETSGGHCIKVTKI